MTAVTASLDARGLNCPLPILRTRKAIKALERGQVLEVEATDPGSLKDMESFCEQTGNVMIASRETEYGYLFLIEKS